MEDKFQNKYRRQSTRLQHWDYGRDAAYFVTICTRDREHFFGRISEGKLQLSPTGVIADIMWYEIKHHAKNVEMGDFVVMPNHIHGIIILNGNNQNAVDDVVERHAFPLHHIQNKTIGQQRFQNQGKNTLSSIIGSYKSAVTKHAHRLNYNFAWQPLFYDHIIRDKKAFDTISAYIQNNVQNWKEDKFNG